METDIGKVGRQRFAIGITTGGVGYAESNSAVFKLCQNPVSEPAYMADLESAAMIVVLKTSTKPVKSTVIKGETRRKLKKDRTELFLQEPGSTEKSFQRFTRLPEPLDVRNIPVGFDSP